jgi:hypothetical protein
MTDTIIQSLAWNEKGKRKEKTNKTKNGDVSNVHASGGS